MKISDTEMLDWVLDKLASYDGLVLGQESRSNLREKEGKR